MGEGKKHDFDLPALLKLGDLDIRGAAEADPALTVRKYYDLLSKFAEYGAPIADALARMTEGESAYGDYLILAEMKDLLAGIGYSMIVPVMTTILDANDKGDYNFVAECAKKISNDFNRVYHRTMTAEKTDKDDAVTSFIATHGASPLRDVIKQMEKEELKRKLIILAVDDAPVVLKTISTVLSGEYKVYTLSNPTMVDKFLHQITPELFLLDYKMPEINGFELVPIIRSFDDHKDTPIIFLTSMRTSDFVSSAAMLGACDFIAKPFQDRILLDKIAKHIVRKKSF